MSVLIKDFDMPKDGCKDCAMVQRGKIFDTCPFLKQEVNGNVERGGKPSGCPLIEVSDTNIGDTISRKAAIDALEEPCKVSDTWTDEYAVGERVQWEKDVKTLNSLSAVQPRKGKWIVDENVSDTKNIIVTYVGRSSKAMIGNGGIITIAIIAVQRWNRRAEDD